MLIYVCRHSIPKPVLNEDYYMDSPSLKTTQPNADYMTVTLFPSILPSDKRLGPGEELDLQEGRAVVYDFEKDCVVDAKMPVYV